MGITRIALKNFKSCKDNFEINNLKPVSVFVGSNNVGKSNIIEGLRFARDLARGSLSGPYELLPFDKNNEPIGIEIDIKLSDEERKKIFAALSGVHDFKDFDFRNNNLFKYVRYVTELKEGQNSMQNESLFITDKNKKYVHIVENARTGGVVNKKYADILNFFQSNEIDNFSNIQISPKGGSTGVFGIFMPHTMDNLISTISDIVTHILRNIIIFDAYRKAQPVYPSGVHDILEESGINLSGVLHTLLSTNRGKFIEIMKIYNNIVGGIKNLNSPPVKMEFTVSIEEEGMKSHTNFDKMSTGLHQALILIVAIEIARFGETICIEEPEIHLHAGSQKRLFNYIREHANKNQFFITTHSSIFSGISGVVSTHIVTKTTGVSQVMQIDDESQLKFIRQQLGIRNSDIFGNDYTIFIEGDSEEYAFPIVSMALGHADVGTDVSDRIRIVNLKGKGIIPKLDQFLRYLNNYGTEVFLIADGDKQVRGSTENFIRMGILKKEHTTVWEKEFEDTFSDKRIIEAMKKLSQKHGFIFSLDKKALVAERNRGENVAKILQKHLHENSQPDLNKPELAKQLAQDIVNDSSKGGKKTEFENEVKRIFGIIDSIDQVN